MNEVLKYILIFLSSLFLLFLFFGPSAVITVSSHSDNEVDNIFVEPSLPNERILKINIANATNFLLFSATENSGDIFAIIGKDTLRTSYYIDSWGKYEYIVHKNSIKFEY